MIITFGNGKGGTGKTTISLATASEAANRGQRVLVVDLDVQGNATEHLIGTGDPLRPAGDQGRGFYRTIMDGDALTPTRARDNIDLMPAGTRTQSLADELNRIASGSADNVGRAFAALREMLHEATSGYDLVIIDTPPSEQSHGLLDCVLVAADAAVIPTKTSKDDITGAVKFLQRLAALDRLGITYAIPLGAALVAVPSGATRVEARAHADLKLITDHLPLFDTRITYRLAPVTEAARRHLTLHELAEQVPTNRERLRQIGKTDGATEHITHDSITKSVAEIAALYDEILTRYTEAMA